MGQHPQSLALPGPRWRPPVEEYRRKVRLVNGLALRYLPGRTHLGNFLGTMRRPFLFIRAVAVVAIAAIVSCSTDTPVDPGKDNDTLPNPAPPDTIPPVAVTDPALAFRPSGDAVEFRWTAPYDDAPGDRVHHYEIRFAFTRGYPPVAFWQLAAPVSNPPTPATPGTPQQHTFTYMEPGKDLWVGIASYDSAGNRSPESDLARVHVPGLELLGRCVDAFSGAPVEGLHARVISGWAQDFTTDADGTFVAGDLLAGANSIQIETGAAAEAYHLLSQILYLDSDTTHTFVAIPARPTADPGLGGVSLLRLFKQLTNTMDPPTILAKWFAYPVRCYIPPFVNSSGVDYEAVSKRAAQRWMDRTGKPLFSFVSSPPDTGIVVVYRQRADFAPLIGLTKHTVTSNSHPIRDEIHIVDDATADTEDVIYRIMLHEFGHTIPFEHVSVPTLIMYIGQPLPVDISDDETQAVLLHWALPTRIDMRIYDEAYP